MIILQCWQLMTTITVLMFPTKVPPARPTKPTSVSGLARTAAATPAICGPLSDDLLTDRQDTVTTRSCPATHSGGWCPIAPSELNVHSPMFNNEALTIVKGRPAFTPGGPSVMCWLKSNHQKKKCRKSKIFVTFSLLWDNQYRFYLSFRIFCFTKAKMHK